MCFTVAFMCRCVADRLLLHQRGLKINVHQKVPSETVSEFLLTYKDKPTAKLPPNFACYLKTKLGFSFRVDF